MTYRFTSAAEHDLASALKWYEEAQTGLGSRFLNELEGIRGEEIVVVAIMDLRLDPIQWQDRV